MSGGAYEERGGPDLGAADDARAAGAGDAAALGRLVPVLYRDATRYLRGRLRRVDPDDLDDFASDGVIKVVERLHTVRAASDREFFAWAHRVVWRATLDARRARGRRDAGWRERPGVPGRPDGRPAPRAVELWDAGGVRVGIVGVEPAGSGAAGVGADEGLDDSPAGVLARLAVESQALLHPDTAAALWAHLIAGAAWADVAARLGTTPAAAKRRFQRALVVLRAAVWARARALPAPERTAILDRLAALDPEGACPDGLAVDVYVGAVSAASAVAPRTLPN